MRALLLALLVVGCGGEALPHAPSYTVTYTLVEEEGNCPPYAPEHLHLGPRIAGDPTCVWAPLTQDVGLNLLCGFPAPTATEPLSWDVDGTGSVRISYPPVCSGVYDVRVAPARELEAGAHREGLTHAAPTVGIGHSTFQRNSKPANVVELDEV